MPRYIDADELYEEIKLLRISLGGKDIFGEETRESILTMISEQPTADVVEVVRCKDCKNWRHETDGMIDHYECTVFCDCYGRGCVTGADDYCSYGERKEK